MNRARFLKTLSIGPLVAIAPVRTFPQASGNRRILVEAHRGFSARAPENTLSAIELAIAAGVDRVEIDLQLSSDGIPVVIHDHTLERTTEGSGRVKDHSFSALKKLDAGSWKSMEYRNERIPSLEEVFELCRNKVIINIDLKTLDAVESLARLIKKWDFEDQIVMTGLVPACVSPIRSFDCYPTMFYESGVRFGQLPEAKAYESAIDTAIKEARRFGLPGFLFHHSWMNSEITYRAHLHGLSVNVWGVDTGEVFVNMLEAGVDAVMCDDPSVPLTQS